MINEKDIWSLLGYGYWYRGDVRIVTGMVKGKLGNDTRHKRAKRGALANRKY